MNRVLIGALCLAAHLAFAGEWKVKRTVDAMSDAQRLTAEVTNESGHTLAMYRTSDGSVWALFSLPSGNTDVLAARRFPMYRIDKLRPRDLDVDRELEQLVRRSTGKELPTRTVVEPKWVNFKLWDGNVVKGRSPELQEFMDGETAVFRYWLFTGGSKDTVFSLVDGRPLIAEALGLSSEIASGSLGRTEAVRKAHMTNLSACQSNAVRVDYSVCAAKVKACFAESADDLARYQGCVSQ